MVQTGVYWPLNAHVQRRIVEVRDGGGVCVEGLGGGGGGGSQADQANEV